MKQGEVCSSKGTNSVYVAIGVWGHRGRPDQPTTIKIAIGRGPSAITTINNKPGRLRYHPKLFAMLKAVLQTENRWPFPD